MLILNEAGSERPKVITRIKGGLGNQLFCYAAARRLALVNNAELVIDDVSGFVRDQQYHRQYALDHFNIRCRKATPAERLEPFERYRRGLLKWTSRRKPYAARRYMEQGSATFDDRLLSFEVNRTTYLDGLWTTEEYFRDVQETIREDLRVVPPADSMNQTIADDIRNVTSVALHVRRFDDPDGPPTQDILTGYYDRAIALLDRKLEAPRYFVFSDDPQFARTKIDLPEDRVTFVDHNVGEENAVADLWLMTQCQHFVTANSTFSWWGAWLGSAEEKIVVSPAFELRHGEPKPWSLSVPVPSDWLTA